jgi:superoxide dismutase, Fe-Mn family
VSPSRRLVIDACGDRIDQIPDRDVGVALLTSRIAFVGPDLTIDENNTALVTRRRIRIVPCRVRNSTYRHFAHLLQVKDKLVRVHPVLSENRIQLLVLLVTQQLKRRVVKIAVHGQFEQIRNILPRHHVAAAIKGYHSISPSVSLNVERLRHVINLQYHNTFENKSQIILSSYLSWYDYNIKNLIFSMHKYEEQKFTIPELKGISKKTIDEHMKLYSGYVKHTNLIFEKITEYAMDSEKNAYVLGELQRRFGFEFNGMRNHEYYFKGFEGGATPLSDGDLKKAIIEEFGSFESWLAMFKAIALTRGIGWAMLYYDTHAKKLVHAWVEEQHLGQLNGLPLVLGLDMWEHSYMLDYVPSEKKKYVEAFFENLNWGVIEANYTKATGM